MTDPIQALREAETQPADGWRCAGHQHAYWHRPCEHCIAVRDAIRDQALVRAFQLVADEMGYLHPTHPDDVAAILRRVKEGADMTNEDLRDRHLTSLDADGFTYHKAPHASGGTERFQYHVRGGDAPTALQKLREAEEQVERFAERLFALGEMTRPPCFYCGYSGRDYYQPATHGCAARHYAAIADGTDE